MRLFVNIKMLEARLGEDWFIGMYFIHGNTEYQITGTWANDIELVITKEFK